MKKIIIAIIVFVVVMAFTMPIFADKSGDPKPTPLFVNAGEKISWVAQNGVEGTHGASWWIKNFKTNATIGGVPVDTELNLGQRMKIWHEKRFE